MLNPKWIDEIISAPNVSFGVAASTSVHASLRSEGETVIIRYVCYNDKSIIESQNIIRFNKGDQIHRDPHDGAAIICPFDKQDHTYIEGRCVGSTYRGGMNDAPRIKINGNIVGARMY